jgi:Zn-finger nucleic acid-binding protein
MKCPNDGAVLTMSERSGVEIDYCPECRGVWLDRGELDKILDRAAAETPSAPSASTPPADYRQQRYQGDSPGGYPSEGHSSGRGYQGSRRPKKKEHWLSELFD